MDLQHSTAVTPPASFILCPLAGFHTPITGPKVFLLTLLFPYKVKFLPTFMKFRGMRPKKIQTKHL